MCTHNSVTRASSRRAVSSAYHLLYIFIALWHVSDGMSDVLVLLDVSSEFVAPGVIFEQEEIFGSLILLFYMKSGRDDDLGLWLKALNSVIVQQVVGFFSTFHFSTHICCPSFAHCGSMTESNQTDAFFDTSIPRIGLRC